MSEAVCADCGGPLQTVSRRTAFCPACLGDSDDGAGEGDSDTAADSERERAASRYGLARWLADADPSEVRR